MNGVYIELDNIHDISMLMAYLKPLFRETIYESIVFSREFADVMQICFDFFENKSVDTISFSARVDETIKL